MNLQINYDCTMQTVSVYYTQEKNCINTYIVLFNVILCTKNRILNFLNKFPNICLFHFTGKCKKENETTIKQQNK